MGIVKEQNLFFGNNSIQKGIDEITLFSKMLYDGITYSDFGSIVICQKIFNKETNKKELHQVKWIKVKNYNHLKMELEKYEGMEDIYININPMRWFKRQKTNVHHLKFLYMDLDVESEKEKGNLDLTINQAIGEVKELARDNKIPYPTMIVNSGRGIHLYWKIGDYSATENNKRFWRDIQQQIEKELLHLGADNSVTTDYARILRVPGTINSKNNKACRIIEYNENCTYTLQEIRDKYFKEQLDKELEEKKKKINKKRASKIDSKVVVEIAKAKTTYTLHRARRDDIISIIKKRDGEMKGRRNIALLQIAYWHSLTHKLQTQEEVLQYTLSINELFKEKLKEDEVKTIVNHALQYKQDKLKASELGLNYSNKRLIDLYKITDEEMKDLITIIDSSVKSNRKLEKKKSQRRNEKGLTSREQQKIDTIKKVKALKNKGFNNTEIAEKLGMNARSIRRILNEGN